MSEVDVFQTVARAGVVPVIVVESADDALPLADALLDGGLPLVEITFRTAAAAEAIQRIRQHRPELLVGAGTLVTAENMDAACDCGAKFGVAPGFNPQRVEQAKHRGLPFMPGVTTPSEMEQAWALGCRTMKFFPAELSGGAYALKSITSPYAHLGMKFMPTGGANTENLATYLALDCVAAVGGTWIATKADIAQGKWQEISARCRQAVEIIAKVRGA